MSLKENKLTVDVPQDVDAPVLDELDEAGDLPKSLITKYRKLNDGVDVLAPGSHLTVKLPAGIDLRPFVLKARLFGIKGRDGSGPVLIRKGSFRLPNGDYAQPGDTFDPAVEGVPEHNVQYMIEKKIAVLQNTSGVANKLLKKVSTK